MEDREPREGVVVETPLGSLGLQDARGENVARFIAIALVSSDEIPLDRMNTAAMLALLIQAGLRGTVADVIRQNPYVRRHFAQAGGHQLAGQLRGGALLLQDQLRFLIQGDLVVRDHQQAQDDQAGHQGFQGVQQIVARAGALDLQGPHGQI